MAAISKQFSLTGTFEKIWRGQHSLPKAFFGFFLLGSMVLAPLAAMIIAVPFVLIDQGQGARAVFFIALIVYPLFSAVGVWRSANVYLLSGANVPFLRYSYVFGAKIIVCIVVGGVFQRATGMRFIDIIARLSH